MSMLCDLYRVDTEQLNTVKNDPSLLNEDFLFTKKVTQTLRPRTLSKLEEWIKDLIFGKHLTKTVYENKFENLSVDQLCWDPIGFLVHQENRFVIRPPHVWGSHLFEENSQEHLTYSDAVEVKQVASLLNEISQDAVRHRLSSTTISTYIAKISKDPVNGFYRDFLFCPQSDEDNKVLEENILRVIEVFEKVRDFYNETATRDQCVICSIG